MWHWKSSDAEVKEFSCGTERVQMRKWKSSDAELKEFRCQLKGFRCELTEK